MRDVERAERLAADLLGGTGNHIPSPSSFRLANQLSLCLRSQGLYRVSEVSHLVPKGYLGVLSGTLGALKLEGGFRFQMRNVNSCVLCSLLSFITEREGIRKWEEEDKKEKRVQAYR